MLPNQLLQIRLTLTIIRNINQTKSHYIELKLSITTHTNIIFQFLITSIFGFNSGICLMLVPVTSRWRKLISPIFSGNTVRRRHLINSNVCKSFKEHVELGNSLIPVSERSKWRRCIKRTKDFAGNTASWRHFDSNKVYKLKKGIELGNSLIEVWERSKYRDVSTGPKS